MLTDFCVVPGVKIKDGVQLLTAIRRINPLQEMAIMTSDPEETREELPQDFAIPAGTAEAPSGWSKCYGCCDSQCCHFDPDGESLIGGCRANLSTKGWRC